MSDAEILKKFRYGGINMIKKRLALLMAMVIVFTSIFVFPKSTASAQTLSERVEGTKTEAVKKDVSTYYSEFLAQHNVDDRYDGDDIPIATDNFAFEGEVPQITKNGILQTEATPSITFEVSTPVSGLYQIVIGYHSPENERSLPAIRTIKINGKLQFDEAERIKFNRFYVDSSKPYVNAIGDEVRPTQEEVYIYSESALSDATAQYSEPFLFYFNEGINSVSIEAIEEDVIIQKISLVAANQVPSYKEYKNEVKGESDTSTTADRVQAEDKESIVIKNSGSILLQSDSDPLCEPYDDYNIRINTIGGDSWRSGNQAVTWKFTVEADGYYQLSFRLKQASGDGLSACRRIEIDGEVPFSELSCYPFEFSRHWYTKVLGDSEPYLFYFTKGEHTLSMTTVTSERTEAYHLINEAIDNASALYRKIIMITGADPDANYDYELDDLIPGLKDSFKNVIKIVDNAKEILLKMSNRTPVVVNNLDTVSQQFTELMEDTDKIATRIYYITDAMTSMGDCLTTLEKTPMLIDWFQVVASNEVIKDSHSNFFHKAWATIKSLCYSFSKDYNAVGGINAETDTDSIEVWVARGREWGEILKQLIDVEFTAKTGINVKVRLLPSGTLGSATNPLLLAINAGNAPDVASGIPAGIPGEYAIRNVLYDLTNFEDFDVVNSQFLPTAAISFTYRDGVYALPEQASTLMMFVRSDIFDELGLKVPVTWNEAYYDLLPALNKNMMQFYVPQDYSMFLYQNGGTYYTEDTKFSALGTSEAYEAFEEYCELYTNMGIPVSANFFNRFRTGEMPIGIASGEMYVQLLTAAPELTGKWTVATIPGKEKEDGTIDISSGGGISNSCVLLAESDAKEASWEYMKWWMSTDTQKKFANALEGQLGISSRWFSANLDALYSLPWKTGMVSIIKDVYAQKKEVPVVPGDYFTSRHLSNAFTRVVTNNENPRDVLEDAQKAIDIELERRRIQLGLN